MSAASGYLENELLDHVLGEGARNFTPPTLYVALFSGPASDVSAALESGSKAASAGNWGNYEINTGGYVRQSINFAAASNGQAASNIVVNFPQATANYNNNAGSGSTVTYVAIVDAVDDGSTDTKVLFYGSLSNAKEILAADTLSIASGSLTVSLA
jgi:hypothetical protein